MRPVTLVTIEEVRSGDWGIAGNAMTTADLQALQAGVRSDAHRTEVPGHRLIGAIKQKQQKTWSSGDFSVIAGLDRADRRRARRRADLHAGWRVLDVATGSGNAAIAAARLGHPRHRRRLRPRAARAARPRRRRGASRSSTWRATPRRCRSATPSSTPSRPCSVHVRRRTTQAAAELVRVTQAGRDHRDRRVDAQRVHRRAVPRRRAKHVPPPAGVQSPLLWARRPTCATCSATRSPRSGRRSAIFAYRLKTAEEFCELFRRWYGPTLKAFEALETDEARQRSRPTSTTSRGAGTASSPTTQSPSRRPTSRRSWSRADRRCGGRPSGRPLAGSSPRG